MSINRSLRLAAITLAGALVTGCALLTPRTGLSADDALAVARTDVNQPPLAPADASPVIDQRGEDDDRR